MILEIALALIRHPSEPLYLIAQRPSGVHLGLLWEFPGGKRLPPESLPDCAIREAFEETGLTVIITDAWPPIPFDYPDRRVLLHPFLCQASSADAHSHTSLQFAWVSTSELKNYSFPPANQALIERLEERVD